jgi:putative isomerase
MLEIESPFIEGFKNHIDITRMPFSTRGSRLTVFCENQGLTINQIERFRRVETSQPKPRKRQPFIRNLIFIGKDGNPLNLEFETYPHKLEILTPIGNFGLIFDDIETLLIRLPEAACGVQAIVHMDSGQTDRLGGVFSQHGEDRTRFSYATNRRIKLNELMRLQDNEWRFTLCVEKGDLGGLVLNITPRLGLNRYIPEIQTAFFRTAQSWLDWISRVPKVAAEYQSKYVYAWWVMRSGLISTRYYITREAMTSSKVHSFPIWQWDAYFHALAFRHIDRKLAQDQLRILIDHQRSNGMLPDAVHDDGLITHWDSAVDEDLTKPPLLAWIAWKLYEKDQDREFLNEIYEPLVRWDEWWFKYNDQDGDGLCEVPQLIPTDMDDPVEMEDNRIVISPDLNTYLYMQMESLSKIARVLGEENEATLWQARADALLQLMKQQLWDGQAGLFWAHQQGRPICVPTPFSLFPLITGKLEPEISQKLVNHLSDPNGFWKNYPLPTVALNDPNMDYRPMWRGPSWVSINYLLMEGLDRSGYPDIADEICKRTLAILSEQFGDYDLNSIGKPQITNAPIYGWTAALFIELAIRASRIKN